MHTADKYDIMRQWLEENPGKDERDWLLETRCTTYTQRLALDDLLKYCDHFNVGYEIAYRVDFKALFEQYCEENPITYIDDEAFKNADDSTLKQEVFAALFSDSPTEMWVDLCFLQKGWILNIGTEFQDFREQLSGLWHDAQGLVDAMRPATFKLHEFEKWVSEKYSFPAKAANDRPWITEYLPWYQDLVKYNFRGVDAAVSNYISFIEELFGSKYNEIKS